MLLGRCAAGPQRSMEGSPVRAMRLASALRHACAANWRRHGAVGRVTAERHSGGESAGLQRSEDVKAYHATGRQRTNATMPTMHTAVCNSARR